MKIELPLKMPTMPSFLTLETENIGRGQGISGKPTVAVGDLTDEQVEEFINEWAKAFRQHVKTRRELRQTIDEEDRRAGF